MTVREKAELIVKDIKKEQGTNPVVIFKQIAKKEYVSIHGPEHHILDGASLLVAYKNAGGEIDLEQALDRLMAEGLRMPGAMCGLWGICGAITSIGAALAIIEGICQYSWTGTPYIRWCKFACSLQKRRRRDRLRTSVGQADGRGP